MQETMQDIVVLLAGIGDQPKTLASFFRQVTWYRNNTRACAAPQAEADGAELDFVSMEQPFSCDSGVEIQMNGNQRNMTAIVAHSNIYIRTRFTGHHQMLGKGGGASTFDMPSFQPELNYLLHNACGNRKPDIIIINSGQHDKPRPHRLYTQGVWNIASRLRPLVRQGVKVLWKGNYGFITKKIFLDGHSSRRNHGCPQHNLCTYSTH